MRLPQGGAPSPSADVAQLVEQLIRNQQVVSSSLTVGSTFNSISYRRWRHLLFQLGWIRDAGRNRVSLSTATRFALGCWTSNSILLALTGVRHQPEGRRRAQLHMGELHLPPDAADD